MTNFKIIPLLLMCFLLINCDNKKKNSPSNKNNNASSSPKQNNTVDDLVINPVKKKLPIFVDALTTLVDIYKEDDVINYKYEVKDMSKYALLLPTTQDTIRDKLLRTYCSDNDEVKQLKHFFPNGANYHYYIDDQEIIIIELQPDDCDED